MVLSAGYLTEKRFISVLALDEWQVKSLSSDFWFLVHLYAIGCCNSYQIIKCPYSFLHVSLALLSLQCFPHTESHTAFIQRLVGSDSHLNLISNPQQQQTPLSTVDGHLSDQLILKKWKISRIRQLVSC